MQMGYSANCILLLKWEGSDFVMNNLDYEG